MDVAFLLVFLLSLVWGWKTFIFKLSGCHSKVNKTGAPKMQSWAIVYIIFKGFLTGP